MAESCDRIAAAREAWRTLAEHLLACRSCAPPGCVCAQARALRGRALACAAQDDAGGGRREPMRPDPPATMDGPVTPRPACPRCGSVNTDGFVAEDRRAWRMCRATGCLYQWHTTEGRDAETRPAR